MISCVCAWEIMSYDKPFLMQLGDGIFLMLVWIAVFFSMPFIAARDRAERRKLCDMPDFRVSQEHFFRESRGR